MEETRTQRDDDTSMASDLFLIAHRVRGEPAFDIAEQMVCSVCNGTGGKETMTDCIECNGYSYWWIIPTSGHRAYPYASTIMLCHEDNSISFSFPPGMPGQMPSNWPDHYPPRHSSSPSLDISALLAPAVKVKIERRF